MEDNDLSLPLLSRNGIGDSARAIEDGSGADGDGSDG